MEDLFRAVKLEDEAVVEKYCKSGGNVNVLDTSSHKKSTPLHWAAYTGNTDVISLLINFGAKLDMQETDGRTPLHLAAFEGHEEAVKVLLAAGSDYTYADESQKTPCDVAIMQQYYEIAKLFPNYKPGGAADPPPRTQVDDLINLRDNTFHSPQLKDDRRLSQINTSEYISNQPLRDPLRSSVQLVDSPQPFESARNRSPNPMQQTQRGGVRSSFDDRERDRSDRGSIDDGRRHQRSDPHSSYQPPPPARDYLSKRDDRNSYDPSADRISGRGSPGRSQTDEPPVAVHVSAGQDAYPVEGTFILAKGKSWEGMPVWECHLPDTGRMGCVYSGANGLWIVTEDACHMNDDSGLITSVHKHGGMFPHEISQWETHDGQSWVVDHSVSVDVVKGSLRRKSNQQSVVPPPSHSSHRDSRAPASNWRDDVPPSNNRAPHSSSSALWRLEEEEEDERHSWWGQEERSRRHLEKRYRRETRELMEEFGSQGGYQQQHGTPDYYRGSERRNDYQNGAHERRAMEAAAARALLEPDDFDAFVEDKEKRRAARRQARREARDEERRIRREARRREKEREKPRRGRSSSRPRKERSDRHEKYDRYGDRYDHPSSRYDGDDKSYHSYQSHRREGRSRSRKRGKSSERSPARSISRSSVRSHSTTRSYRSSSRRSHRSRSRSRSRGRDKPNPRPWLPPGSSNSVTGKRISQTFSDYGTPLRGWEEGSPIRHRSVSRGRHYY